LATILTDANPHVVSREKWKNQPESPDSPIATENTLAAEASPLSRFTKPGSVEVFMR
jgi:hypothetical protein